MNSGIFAARLAAVVSSIRIAGLSLPCSSMCVRYSCVYKERPFDENTSQRPFGEKLCHEFMILLVRVQPPRHAALRGNDVQLAVGTHQAGPILFCTKTIHLPSGETFGKLLLIPFSEAPAIFSALPPLPLLNGMR